MANPRYCLPALAERGEGDEFVAEARRCAPGAAAVVGAGEPAFVAAGVGGGFLKPLGGERAVGADNERGESGPVFHEERGGDDRAWRGECGGAPGAREACRIVRAAGSTTGADVGAGP